MQSEFVFYPTTLDSVPHSIRVDIYAHQNFETFPHAGIIMVPYQAKEDGYPAHEEFERLNSLEDAIVEHLVNNGSLFMGAITGNGSLDLFFAKQTPFGDVDFSALNAEGQFELVEHLNNSEALYVNYLYPNVYEQQYIANQDYCKQLLDQGEAFEVARDVVFYASFHDNESAHAFAHEFEKMTKEAHIHLSQDGHIHVHMTISMIPDVMTINTLTDRMVQHTEGKHGHFEGWQTTVVTAKDA